MWFFMRKKEHEQQILQLHAHYQKRLNEQEQRQAECENIELQMLLGKLVICVSNEIEDMIVAEAEQITFITKARVPMLLVRDLLTQEQLMPFGKVFVYTPQKLSALSKLTCDERTALIYHAQGEHLIDKRSSQIKEPMPIEQWLDLVEPKIAAWKQQKNAAVWALEAKRLQKRNT